MRSPVCACLNAIRARSQIMNETGKNYFYSCSIVVKERKQKKAKMVRLDSKIVNYIFNSCYTRLTAILTLLSIFLFPFIKGNNTENEKRGKEKLPLILFVQQGGGGSFRRRRIFPGCNVVVGL